MAIFIKLEIDGDEHEALRAIDKLLDAGGIQDPIAEYIEDVLGGGIEITSASCYIEADGDPEDDRVRHMCRKCDREEMVRDGLSAICGSCGGTLVPTERATLDADTAAELAAAPTVYRCGADRCTGHSTRPALNPCDRV